MMQGVGDMTLTHNRRERRPETDMPRLDGCAVEGGTVTPAGGGKG